MQKSSNTGKSVWRPLQRPPVIPLPDPTLASDPLSHYQPIRLNQPNQPKRPKPVLLLGCGCLGIVALLFAAALLYYLGHPGRTRLLLLGIDRAPDGTAVSRSDTIILMQTDPFKPEVEMLSIPRDLWVPIPGVGENRINTAHFFAEANQAGSGPQAVIQVIADNFGIRPTYYARVQFDGFKDVVDAMGGLDLDLKKSMGGLEAGKHHLNGTQALAFARDRKGTDDFFRMNQGQVVILAAARQMLNPLTWPRLPAVAATFLRVVDTDLPFWEWPRVAFALLRAGPDGADHRTIPREMVTPFTTSGGAQVLQPKWDLIRSLVQIMFEK
jgi:polyisoprenyl-teichoic acid--peptidoglycan teichoic acid transferase